jgi:hypothetical protein
LLSTKINIPLSRNILTPLIKWRQFTKKKKKKRKEKEKKASL